MAERRIPHSQLGRASIDGHARSPQQKQKTIRGEPVWKRFEALPRNGVVGPPSPESLTPEQQKFKHEGVVTGYTPTTTPPVPLGMGRKNRAKQFTEQPPG